MSSITSAEFGRLFVRYRERFVALADSYVHDRAAAEDIVADAFTKFWDARESIELKSCPPPSLYSFHGPQQMPQSPAGHCFEATYH